MPLSLALAPLQCFIPPPRPHFGACTDGSCGVPPEVLTTIETLLPTGKGAFLELWAQRGVRRWVQARQVHLSGGLGAPWEVRVAALCFTDKPRRPDTAFDSQPSSSLPPGSPDVPHWGL